MGEAKKIAGRNADFREPSRPEAVKQDSSGLYRRPEPSGASAEEEARYEARQTAQLPGDTSGGSGSASRRPGRGPEAQPLATPALAELPLHRQGSDAALPTAKRCRTRIVDLPRVTIEEVDANVEEERAMMEALRLLAKWICRLPREKSVRERKAA